MQSERKTILNRNLPPNMNPISIFLTTNCRLIDIRLIRSDLSIENGFLLSTSQRWRKNRIRWVGDVQLWHLKIQNAFDCAMWEEISRHLESHRFILKRSILEKSTHIPVFTWKSNYATTCNDLPSRNEVFAFHTNQPPTDWRIFHCSRIQNML